MSIELAVAITTCGSVDQAERLGRLLVEQRLAACVQIGSAVRSVYPWEGRIETASEIPMSIKTLPERIPDLKQAIENYHPYSVPELLILSTSEALRTYAEWVGDWVGEAACDEVDTGSHGTEPHEQDDE